MKKAIAIIVALGLVLSTSGCKGDEKVNQEVNVPIYEDDCKIELFADISRNAEDPQTVKQYFDAGFTSWVMTEDSAPLTDENGNITKQYLDNIEHVAGYGEVYIRNHYNYVNCWNNPQVQEIERWGEKIIVPKRNITTEFSEMDGVKGYFQMDEPSYSGIEEMIPLVEWHNTYANEKIFHANLFPSYGASHFSNHDFEEYIQHYVDTILAKVKTPKHLGIDNYPLLGSGGKNTLRPTYLSDLLTVSTIAKEYNSRNDKTSDIRVGFCIQSFRDVSIRDIECKEDISFQVNTCLAMGAKYLEYYLYCTIGEQVGILDAGDEKRPLYDYVKEVNEELQKWDHVIMSFDWQGVKTVKGTDEHDNEVAFAKVDQMELANLQLVETVESRLDTIVGEFVDKDGNFGYMTVNYTEPSEQKIDYVTYSFKEDIKSVLVYQNGESRIETLDDTHKLTVRIPAGGGVFVIPCK